MLEIYLSLAISKFEEMHFRTESLSFEYEK